jgi:hypothetical protein
MQARGWYYWMFELSLVSTTAFGANDEYVKSWSFPLLEAFIAGAWILHFTDDTIYWVAKPIVRTEFNGDTRRLHSETLPALESDIEDLYFWHGVLVPAHWIIDRKNLTAAEVIKSDNLEQRAAGCEIVGWANVLKELSSKVIDQDSDPEIGTLLEVDIPDSGKELFLKVLCATGREFAVCVTNSKAKTALQAQQWMFPVPESLGKFIKPQLTA